MRTIIFLCGLYNISFIIFHVLFWKIFHWDKELKTLSFANKAIMQILNVQLIYYFGFVAFVCFVFPDELLNTKLGTCFLGGTALFWLIRSIQQLIFLRINNYKIHLLTIIFLTGTILFTIPAIG